MTGSNPFASAEAWEVSAGGPMLPVGDFVVTIVQADDATASTQNPQVEFRFQNDSGSIRAWETYHANFLSKIVSVYDAAGIARPDDGEFDPTDNCRLTQKKLDELMGKQVGIVIREEEDNRPDHYGEKRARVQGYLPASEIAPAETAVAATDGDPDIPF